MATREEQDKAKAEQAAKDQAKQQEQTRSQQDEATKEQLAKGTAVAAEPGQGDRSAADLDRDRRVGRASGTVTDAQAAEYDQVGVNVALDNRTGDQRPQRQDFPAVPQQVDGPEVGHFAEHAEQTKGLASKFAAKGDRPVGMKSEGPHGLGLEDTIGDDADRKD